MIDGNRSARSGAGKGHRPWALMVLAGGLWLTGAQLPAWGDASDTAPVTFNSGFLQGQARGMDLSRYANGNPTLAGTYHADIYVNGAWKGRSALVFETPPGEVDARTCFTLETLERYGVDTTTLVDAAHAALDECRPLEAWIPEALTQLNTSTLRFDVTIPQAYLRRTARGYVDPRFWDPGVTAGLLGYNFNAFQSRRQGDGGGTHNTAHLTLNGGFNVAGWQLRHHSNLSSRSGQGSHWQNTSTYARRPIPGWQSEVVLGDAHTDGELFDAIGFRGVKLSSDDRMLPDALRGYAPVVRGVATSNALVEIRQRGQLIYQTTVPPGPFVVDDLYATGYGGDLEVTIIEADGQRQHFVVPYASVAQMLRPGVSRYNVTAGRVRDSQLSDEPWLWQGTYQRGLTNALTVYAGTTLSEDYAAALAGAAVGTPIGAFSFDVTHAHTGFERRDSESGQSYKIGYSKLIPETSTNFTVAAYRYSTSGYLGLREAVLARDYERRGLDVDALNRQRSELQLTVNQGLPPGYGALYLTGSLRDYWNEPGTSQHYQIGYNNHIGSLSYGISARRTRTDAGDDDTQYHLNFSLPISSGAGAVSLHGNLTQRGSDYESSRMGISGSAGVDGNLTYNASLSDRAQGATTGEISAQYRSPYATLRGSHSHSNDYRQTGLGASGSLVAHEGGVTLTPQRGDTMVIIEAPGATGARVTNTSGVRVDGRGYAVVPYVTPYRLNAISLDPNEMSNQVELQTNRQQVAPHAGAIARLRFDTVTGRALLIQARRQDGGSLPFGTDVYDEAGQPVGIVGQGSRIYLRTERDSGSLTARWGDGESCTLHYRLPPNVTDAAYEHLESHCEN